MWSVGLNTKYTASVLYKAYEIGMLLVVVSVSILTYHNADQNKINNGLWTGLIVVCFVLGSAGIVGCGSEKRLAVLGGGPNIFGRNMALLSIGSIFAANTRGKYFFWLVVCSLCGALTVLSGSRGALFSAILGLGTTFLLIRIKIYKKILIFWFAAVFSTIILLVTPIGHRTIEIFQSRIIHLTFEQKHTSGRSELYEQAIEIGKNNFYFGTGLGGYTSLTDHNYPHNIFLEAFTEGGVVGLFLLSISLGDFAISSWRKRKEINPFLMGAFVLFFMASQFSGSLFDSRSVFIFLLIASLSYKARPKLQDTQRMAIRYRYLHLKI
jgi:O-antigen ligase